jgi:DUF4097 and DUF4098 domain-containing protein YvlB
VKLMKRHVALAFVLLATWAAPAAAQSRRDEEEMASRIDTTFTFDRRGTLVIVAGTGEVDVSAWDRPQIRIRARAERSMVRMDATATRVSLDISRPRGGDARFEVTVPVGVRVSARSTSGDVVIAGTKAPVEARTQSGDLSVTDVGEIVDLNTYSGDVTARDITGNVEITTLSGEVMLSDVKGDVDATSVSGDIELRGVVARYIRAKRTSGDVRFDGPVDNSGRYELGSHSGSVYLTIPQASGALLTIATYSGSIESDFPITLKPGEHGIGSSKRFTFEIGKGDARVSAESFSGDITIRSSGRRPTDPR